MTERITGRAVDELRGVRPRSIVLLIAVTSLAAPLLRADDPPLSELPITDADRSHWSFRPVLRPQSPGPLNPDWCANAIDAFILARLEDGKLRPMPPASRRTLIRRATFTLTGLPPTPREIGDFLADQRPDAWEHLLDRLLASPGYGERFAQHWLDLARFADTDGFEHDLVRPNAWRYRDWVIDAFNRDLPYDEFLRLQLAGDEIAPSDPAAQIATGFLLSGPDMPDLNSQEERRHNVLNDMTATLGSVVMALQLGCAQCHDHKFDPLSQADFYRLRAFFEPAEFFKEHPLPASTDPMATSRTLVDLPGPAGISRLMVRGDHLRPGAVVLPQFLRVVALSSDPPGDSRPMRRQLATWLTRPDHPLTARVIVNRVWQWHFGRGLVESSSDFGLMGDSPTHPELLDWLATTFAASASDGGCGWSLKQLHRLILSSATWRQASRPSEGETGLALWNAAKAADPQNRLWSRMPRQRLDGEAIRDALLASADRLSSRRGGPSVRPPLPPELVGNLLKDHWVVSPDPTDHQRRSLYLFARRNLRYPLFEAFDRPDPNTSCPRRTRSTIAPQALFLLNSELSLAAARDLAACVRREAGDDPSKSVDLIWQRALGRPATTEEQKTALASMTARPEEPLAGLCLAVFNSNEFVYVD